jgi:hypothetical protein
MEKEGKNLKGKKGKAAKKKGNKGAGKTKGNGKKQLDKTDAPEEVHPVSEK